MKAAIIGGGIGGLTTAIGLSQAGIDFELFEAAPELKPVGAGIVMASNAMTVFRHLGMNEKVAAAGREIAEARIVDESSRLISNLNVKAVITPRYGVGSYAIHRGRLQQVLLSEIDNAKIRTGKRLTGLVQDGNKPVCSFEDGTDFEADIVIGADGIRSAVRRSIFGDCHLRYSGQTCWRGMAHHTLPEAIAYNSVEMWGNEKGLRFGFVPTASDEVYYFTTFFTRAGIMDDEGTRKSELLKRYRRFGRIAVEMIEATRDENIIRSDIFDLKPIPQWHNGRVVLLGDAAHATTPNLGQGGCQAVEDAFVLSRCLNKQGNISDAFAQYQHLRYRKALSVVNTSWMMGMLTNAGHPLLRAIRNAACRMIPQSVNIRQLDKILNMDYALKSPD